MEKQIEKRFTPIIDNFGSNIFFKSRESCEEFLVKKGFTDKVIIKNHSYLEEWFRKKTYSKGLLDRKYLFATIKKEVFLNYKWIDIKELGILELVEIRGRK